MSSEDLLRRRQKLQQNIGHGIQQLKRGQKEIERIITIQDHSAEILEDLDRQFEERTGLTSLDITLLFLAVGLQTARWFFMNNKLFRFKNASSGDAMMNKALSLAPPDWRDVLTQSVPYDAIRTGDHVSHTGLSGTTHQYRTLGHDPIFGWVVGTANIMTNSLTKCDLETFQVKDQCIIRHYPGGMPGMMSRAITYGINDPQLLAVSVARQAIHFGSDYFTKQGLPVPGISTINNNFAKKMLTEWHLDMWSITRSAALAALINQLVAIIHRLFFDGTSQNDKKFYEVRTRKIISYSNLIAETANIGYVVVTKDISKLDIGGIGVALYQLITNQKFIRKIKREFIFGSFKDKILDDSFLSI